MFDDDNTDEIAEGPSREDLHARITELEGGLAEAEDRYLRAAAELRNYRQRVVEQQAQQMQYAHEQLISVLLPILDHLELALQSADGGQQSPQEVLAGVKMIYRQLGEALEQFGLTRLETVGQQFDPQWHEAIERRLIEDEAISAGQIVEEFRPGYKLRDRLLRPAEVCVCTRPETPEEARAGE